MNLKHFLLIAILILACMPMHGSGSRPFGQYFTVLSYNDNSAIVRAEFPTQLPDVMLPSFNLLIPEGKSFKQIELKMARMEQSYLHAEWLGGLLVRSAKVISIRNYNILQVTIDPGFEINNKKKFNFTGLEYEITFEDDLNYLPRPESGGQLWNKIIADLVINPEDIGIHDLNKSRDNDGATYLIIASDLFVSALQQLKQFRMQQGIETTIFSTSEIGGSVADISDFIADAYYNWTIPPEAVLLVGDIETLPSPIWDNYSYSDNLYADVDGDDLPEVVISRLPVSNTDQLDMYLDRIIDFELNPPADQGYYDHPLSVTSFENASSVSWMITEIFNGFYTNKMQKDPVRVFAGAEAPQDWPSDELLQAFGPEGLDYIPSSPEYLSAFGGGTASEINNALNSGAMSFFSFAQGSATGWSAPSYHVSDLGGLSGAAPAFLISMNSLNGNFGYGQDCFAEAYLFNPNGGTGVVAPSENIYLSGADWFTFGLIDGIWDEFLPGTSNMNGDVYLSAATTYAKFFLDMSPVQINPQTKKSFYYLFHHFGAPYVPVFDQVPGEISVLHGDNIYPGQATFEVLADSGAVVSLLLNGQINAVMKSTGNTLVMPLFNPQEGDTLHVTATFRNHKRYHARVMCSQSNGISKTVEGELNVYPVPAVDYFEIRFPCALPGVETVKLMDMTGHWITFDRDRLQIGNDNIRVDVSGMNSGVFVLKIKTGKAEFTCRILILR